MNRKCVLFLMKNNEQKCVVFCIKKMNRECVVFLHQQPRYTYLLKIVLNKKCGKNRNESHIVIPFKYVFYVIPIYLCSDYHQQFV